MVGCLSRLLMILVPIAFAAVSAAGQTMVRQSDALDDNPTPGASLSSQRRLVGHFDFEQRERVPIEMPRRMYRILSSNPESDREGFPAFGTMNLADDAAASGKWSLKFDLGGGSMAAAVPTSVLTVLPGVAYRVSARVRTAGLTHARARVIARLHDKHGDAIPGAEFASPLLETTGQWRKVDINLPGNFPAAADLVYELQLLQPEKFRDPARATEPMLEDVSGSAWFDDVKIQRMPQVNLTTTAPHNIGTGEGFGLRVAVRDIAGRELTARLRIYDLDGKLIQQNQFTTGGPGVKHIDLQTSRRGWYRAVLAISRDSDPATLTAAETLDFALLNPDTRLSSGPSTRFGVAIADASRQHLDGLADLINRLCADTMLMTVWNGDDSGQSSDQLVALQTSLDTLVGTRPDIELLFALPEIATSLPATDNGNAASQPNQSLRNTFLTLADYPAMWSVGEISDAVNPEIIDVRAKIAAARDQIGRFSPSPEVHLASSADQPLPTGAEGVILPVAHQIRPESIPEYIQHWRDSESELTLLLKALPQQFYTPRDRLTDLTFRVLHAWKAGAERLLIDQPWAVGSDQPIEPQPQFVLWRELATRLGERTFAGRVGFAPGLEVWVARSQRGESGLIAWNQSAPDSAAVIDDMLATGEVSVVDTFGNERTVKPVNGRHRVPLTARPVFIEGVDIELMKFRSTATIEPAFAPSIHRLHDHTLVLTNPWPMTISGTIHFTSPTRWEFNPRLRSFTIPSGEIVHLPVSFSFNPTELAGKKRIQAAVTLQADEMYDFRLSLPFRVGMKDISCSAVWRLAENVRSGEVDLIVIETIINHGQSPASVEAFASGPGYIRMRKPIADLRPGERTVRSFRFTNGAAQLSGQTLRYGISQLTSAGRLNKEMTIPRMPQR